MRCFLFLGDITGDHGKQAIQEFLPLIIEKFSPTFVIANGENITGGYGISVDDAMFLYEHGVHVITLGNHAFTNSEVYDMLGNPDHRVICPANFCGIKESWKFTTIERDGIKLCVINLIGNVGMSHSANNPFQTADEIFCRYGKSSDVVLIDFHAEDPEEKFAMGHFMCGKATAVLGTHLHLPTNDARLIANKTAYMTDVGMCGNYNWTIYRKYRFVVSRHMYWHRKKLPSDPVPDIAICFAVVFFEEGSRYAKDIKSYVIRRKEQLQ